MHSWNEYREKLHVLVVYESLALGTLGSSDQAPVPITGIEYSLSFAQNQVSVSQWNM